MKCVFTLLAAVVLASAPAGGQEYGKPDTGQPGDRMIQEYLRRESEKLDARFLDGIKSAADWNLVRPRYKQEYFHMLGLWPLPEKTPLKAAVTGTLSGEGFTVENLHYQSRPRLYVTANLYRPAKVEEGRRLPAILYLCGHSSNGRNGNKTSFQSHGIWFARHGYICLVLDTLQLGEIAALHHGTYREERWWWHSRGYTPAGVECWNGIRGIDYLISRPDVDPGRIAVTGISGGGAATFWIAAADERARVAVPVSGMADLLSYVSNRTINGHCDCMFLYNTFQWPWTRIAALITPRPLLFVNSDRDPIFPMDANERIINRLERHYSLFEAGDLVDSLVSMGGHDYRKDIRRAVFRFINIHLKGDPAPVEDSEVDLVTGEGSERAFPIDPVRLRVFPEDSDIPSDELNTTIDEHFVPLARVEVPGAGQFDGWKNELLAGLREASFRQFPDRIPPGRRKSAESRELVCLETEEGIDVYLEPPGEKSGQAVQRIILLVKPVDSREEGSSFLDGSAGTGDAIWKCEPRGVGRTRWTRKNPPNYVERSHVLLGQTADTGRVLDVVAAARYLKKEHGVPLWVAGEGGAAVLAAYAALFEDEIEGAILGSPPLTHMDAGAPQFLNVLRVCDVSDVLGMLAPRRLAVNGQKKVDLERIARIYAAAGSPGKFTIGE
jgi:dienelactone hydrolase